MKILDADSHLTEPPNLWLERLPRRWAEDCPRVGADPRSGKIRWRIGGRWLAAVGVYSDAPWPEWPPSHPADFDQIDRACYDPVKRKGWLNEYGITAQVLYPNVVAFEGHALLALQDEKLRVAIIQAYNDYAAEFSSQVPDTFIPIAALPFWNPEATIREMERAKGLGYKGVLWAATLDRHGLPGPTDPHWDRVYAAAQDLGMSVNFHVGVGKTQDEIARSTNRDPTAFDPAVVAKRTALSFLSNAKTIADLILDGVCYRFPRLKFVSVESGFGYVPYLLEALDWQFKNNNGLARYPEWILPSDYFRRQIYATFWFEESTLQQIGDFVSNVMFETDFPHNTSLTPSRGSASPRPDELITAHIRRYGEETMKKVLWDTGAELYGLE